MEHKPNLGGRLLACLLNKALLLHSGSAIPYIGLCLSQQFGLGGIRLIWCLHTRSYELALNDFVSALAFRSSHSKNSTGNQETLDFIVKLLSLLISIDLLLEFGLSYLLLLTSKKREVEERISNSGAWSNRSGKARSEENSISLCPLGRPWVVRSFLTYQVSATPRSIHSLLLSIKNKSV